MRRMMAALRFDNLTLRALPIDPIAQNYTREVPNACFSRVQPTPVKNPELVAVSFEALGLLGLGEEDVQHPDFVAYLSGNKLLPGAEPAAHCYCGYQFGYFSGQLGDGATMYLGEVINARGERWELQFKGAGPTPYSRAGDGRKVLRSSIREFLCSEAMWHLGIPTTRAGTVVTSESTVVRDIHYNGNRKMEKATVITRIAPSFLRFGSFEIFTPLDHQTRSRGPSFGNDALRRTLTEHVENTFYKETVAGLDETQRHVAFVNEVARRTARLAAAWQSVGFCHGVLNTDNMSILGLTIDYGPFGFLEEYDADYICNGSDDGGRYSYASQPAICRWNVGKLVEALGPLLPAGAKAAAEEIYDREYDSAFKKSIRAKLGLLHTSEEADLTLFSDLLDLMREARADFTNTFRRLSTAVTSSPEATIYALRVHWASFDEVLLATRPKIQPAHMPALTRIFHESPEMLQSLGLSASFVKAEIARTARREALEACDNEDAFFAAASVKWRAWLDRHRARLHRDLPPAATAVGEGALADAPVRAPTAEAAAATATAAGPVPATSELIAAAVDAVAIGGVGSAGSAAGDAGSDGGVPDATARVAAMNRANPAFVLRNYILQQAIERAEKGDYSEVVRLLERLKTPYEEQGPLDIKPEWARTLCVTCSS